MRMSVINHFAKNDRSLSGRRRVAVLAATTVLAGGVQFLATDTAWACGDASEGAATIAAPAKPSAPAQHEGSFTAGFHMTPDGQSITAGGAKVEIGVGVTNFTGAPYQNVSAMLSLYNPMASHPEKGPAAALRAEDLTVEVATANGWKPVGLRRGCDPTLFTLASPATTTARLENGRAANFMFRVGLSAKAPKDLTEIQIGAVASAPGFGATGGEDHTYRVVRTAGTTGSTTPAKPKPTPTKAAPTKAAPTKAAPTKAAEPAVDRTKDTAPSAPAAPATPKATTPATTAPAGTPELAQTGSSSTNAFLAAGSALFLALGAGVLIAVRRLRPQR
ncbi:LAETG motif-containing sortase-dependent surface protein [Kitasatospora sp. NPDC005856]|uniref:LAETG motif-containing sortase-dependent surface protein n=1 Tax=Kitasatospora sp. NPDC005856 TaxID=3154566 RepID=UPI0033E874DE